MVINENNAQINAFVKGMNTDTAYDQVDNQSYVYGENVRITKNISIDGNESGENYSSVHEGCITPVYDSKEVVHYQQKIKDDEIILSTDSINVYSVIITKNEASTRLKIYRSIIDEDNDIHKTDLWCVFNVSEQKDAFESIKSLSTVLYQELEGVIKLYIATGVYPVIELRIDGEQPSYGDEDDPEDVDKFINNRVIPQYPVWIDAVVDGSLKTSQIQYTYRYYNKFGITTQLAPLTNKIQVIDSNRSKETGNAEDTVTSIGFKIQIKHRTEYADFKRLQIFRLSYIKPGEDANVELIYDGEIPDGDTFTFNDVGTIPLSELTMQEFGAMSGMIVIPKIIEQNQQYLFASNVKDDTIISEIDKIEGGVVQQASAKVTLSTNITGAPEQESSQPVSNMSLYFEDRNINPANAIDSYNNIFTSSLLRSLRRGETYHYGIVYYDKYGRRSNVWEIPGDGLHIAEISSSNNITEISGGKLAANVIGAEITLPQPKDKNGKVVENIIGCQIVRRSSKNIYQKTLLQVALARPVKQKLYTNQISNWGEIISQDKKPDIEPKDSPYYPTGFLWTDYTRIFPGYMPFFDNTDYEDNIGTDIKYTQSGWNIYHYPKGTDYFTAVSKENDKLFQIFSSEINFRRDDVLSILKSNSLTVHPVFSVGLSTGTGSYSYQKYNSIISEKAEDFYYVTTSPFAGAVYVRTPQITERATDGKYTMDVYRHKFYQDPGTKSQENNIFPLYSTATCTNTTGVIKSVKDVKIPEWFDGFSNLQLDGSSIAGGGIKKYQQFITNIDEFVFDNWISFGLYDHRISGNDNQQNNTATCARLFLDGGWPRNKEQMIDSGDNTSWGGTRGIIGPGTSCFLMTIDPTTGAAVAGQYGDTVICNIEHSITSGTSEPDEFIQYFGFGNFFRLELENNVYKVIHSNGSSDKMQVFDGDIYITPQEIATMYKTYDFMSYDTLQSTQVINYVPMESKVNTFFDYGMNYLNTNSTNIMTEPGSIEGVTTQDRPVHQYNQIYSANDESNDVFTLIVEKSEDNKFKQRTYYSEPKINGEHVDNFVIFKPAAYIDVDSKYGEITNLLTDKNTLYYWQDTAFGKFSVNERSLINDQNGNTIMLGQAGILSRNDYISTKYGMRMYDFCATSAENGVYWVDINNKAVVANIGNDCINFGERLNVQNLINSRIGPSYIPRVDYDVQNSELLCKFLKDKEYPYKRPQLVFNLKANIATSVYTRTYSDIVSIKNCLYGVNIYVEFDHQGQQVVYNKYISYTKYNYLSPKDIYNPPYEFLTPMKVSFVVNPNASTTKTFDSQQLVPAKRMAWWRDDENSSDPEYYTKYFDGYNNNGTTVKFETDINSTSVHIGRTSVSSTLPYTEREGNIIYNIPRFGNNDWGNRLRGKWMRVDFNFKNPTEYTTMSHVITKFRQSYS